MMKIEQQRRLQIVEKGCEKLTIPRSLANFSDQYLSHLIVESRYKILFNYIPKVSCTMWKELFDQLHRTHLTFNIRFLTDLIKPESRRFQLETCRKAVFVREPLTRLLSMYFSKFCNYGEVQRLWEYKYGWLIVQNYREGYHSPPEIPNKDSQQPFMNITFSEFIRFITDNINKEDILRESGSRVGGTDHFLPQSTIASPCAIHYDFIGHFENLSTEAPYMLNFLGVDHIVQYPGITASEAEKKLVDEYKKVPLELLYKLEQYYHADYELFGYSFNDTLKRIITSGNNDDN
ncbi:carbohydrate sulfotransferase 14-like [Amphiura filiformis]|uniref:carbohydrate sulfotransferase 14-like n=1 Tax=Amphiura filiformis TaxID=82378 RepID=UPI003B21B1DA